MAWLKSNPRLGQFLVLALLVLALFGPWIISDLIYVPAQSDCDPPWLRLEGDYCGMPYSGLAVVGFGIRALLALVDQVLSGSVYPADLRAVLLIAVVCTLLLLPYATTLLRLATANHRPGRKFAAAVWVLAAAAGVLLILVGTWHPFYLMWGIWLLTGLALVMLVVEVRKLREAGGSTPPSESI